MRPAKLTAIVTAFVTFTPFSLLSQIPQHGMTIADLATMVRVGAPQVSPDGKWVCYTVAHTDVSG